MNRDKLTALAWLALSGLLVVFAAGTGRAQATDGGAPAEPPTAQQIAQWVSQLDDDQFVVRTHATDQLILAGAAAADPVAKAVERGNLEVATRGVLVLRELALSSDVTSEEQGLLALQQLARSPARSTARLARSAIDALADVRQQRTIEQLQRLGAQVMMSDRPVGFQLERHLAVEIGPQWAGTLPDLQRLRWLRDVRSITFEGPRVTDAWIAAIQELERLELVAIKHAQVTDDALRVVGQMKSVASVDLMYTPVTDAGLDHLRGMKSLLAIRCYGTEITRQGADKFQLDMAHVTMQHKLGAFLGVSCQRPPWPCEVLQVTEDSAAIKAGIVARDIIVSYDNKEVATFDDLQNLIARNRVGDTVDMEVARGGELLMMPVSRRPRDELGLAGETTSMGLRVTQLQPGGSAADAGVRLGDLILAVDDERISKFSELEKLYKQNVEDGVVRFQVLRDLKIYKLKVTFGEWNQ